MTHAYRWEFLTEGFHKPVPPPVANALFLIDRNFEVIYDRNTAPSAGSPAHHLYRKIRSGGVPGQDYFVLEFSLQHDMSKQWPLGKPRDPDYWLIEEVKSRLKDATGLSNEKAIAKKLDDAEADEQKNAADKQKVMDNETEERTKDFVKLGVKGRMSRMFDGAKK